MLGFKHRQSGGRSPWQYVGASASLTVSTTAANLSPALPAGVQQGDLLIFCAASRGATSPITFTPGSGWTTVNAVSNQNDTNETTSSTAGAYMAYMIHGASPPSSPYASVSSVSRWCGRIVAYRGAAGANVQASSLGGGSLGSTTINMASLTTAKRSSLIVVAGALSRNTSASNFRSSTGAIASSVGSGSTDNPLAEQFLERFDSANGTSPTAGLVFADAVLSIPGATGIIAFDYVAGGFSRGIAAAFNPG